MDNNDNNKVLDKKAIKKMQEAFINEDQVNARLDPKNSTNGVHIYNKRSFRSYSW